MVLDLLTPSARRVGIPQVKTAAHHAHVVLYIEPLVGTVAVAAVLKPGLLPHLVMYRMVKNGHGSPL